MLKLSNRVLIVLTDTSSLTTETKPPPKATSSNFQQTQTSPLPQMTSITSASATSSMSDATSIMSTMSRIRLASSVVGVAVIARLVPNRGKFFYTTRSAFLHRVLVELY